MENQNYSDDPASNTEREPSDKTPVPCSPPQEGQVGKQRDTNANEEQNVSTELAREFITPGTKYMTVFSSQHIVPVVRESSS